MVAMYNLDFDIVALVLMIIEIVYLQIQYSHDKYSNRLFTLLTYSSLILTISDMASSLMLTQYVNDIPGWVLKLVCSVYYLLVALVFLVFYRYIVAYLGEKNERTVSYYVMTYFPFVFAVECLIANCFANVMFSGGSYGNFSYGSLMAVIYVYPFYYYALTIIYLIRCRQSVTFKQVISVVSFIVLTIVSLVVQIYVPATIMMPFGFAISLLIMMMSLETPDYKKLMKTTEILETVRDEVEMLDSFHKAFITEMSDEIGDYVDRVIVKTESLDRKSMGDSQRELCEYVEGYGRLTRTVLFDINEFGTIGEIHGEMQPQEYNIRDIVSRVQKRMIPLVEDTANTFDIDINDSVPDVLIGCESHIKQVMINLLCNATQYTYDGRILLSVGVRKTSHDSINLIISVEDTGAGFDRETVRKLLQFNTRAKRRNREVFADGNFKIRIAKKLIEGMHGKLHIDSNPGKGSVYTAVIPQMIPWGRG